MDIIVHSLVPRNMEFAGALSVSEAGHRARATTAELLALRTMVWLPGPFVCAPRCSLASIDAGALNVPPPPTFGPGAPPPTRCRVAPRSADILRGRLRTAAETAPPFPPPPARTTPLPDPPPGAAVLLPSTWAPVPARRSLSPPMPPAGKETRFPLPTTVAVATATVPIRLPESRCKRSNGFGIRGFEAADTNTVLPATTDPDPVVVAPAKLLISE